MLTQRYHLTLGPKRTTVNLDNNLSLLLSLKLGQPPQTPQAQRAVRDWLQARLDRSNDVNRSFISRWLRDEVVHALLGEEVTKRYNQWLDDLIEHNRSARQQASTSALAATAKNG